MARHGGGARRRGMAALGEHSFMNKTEAAQFLGIGVRSLERYTGDGRIVAHKVKGKTGPTLDYAPDDLERFKIGLEAPLEDSPVPPPNSATALARLPRPASSALMSTRRERERPSVGVEHLLLLRLDEAGALTGLSRHTLRAAIDDGTLKAKQIGRAWRMRREDLEAYVKALF